ncbi:MAG: bifunctional phosphoribosyl-AMP cyclohydrolase/phosphoribosyl-ATP diphosphatase HisIE [Bdellovibrionaceae bacterium]|jgi:phosphoribosyl-AMP cyclohydrolase / phosphoribosyl-ATP pyrophosphohydrolase|nr:bifunctional phosphoribosyl-AMP cyclohydrolase/phosphoribosyl-ATP diphosphatase HisIE [Pseudobdellovibrionaceae bacterium]
MTQKLKFDLQNVDWEKVDQLLPVVVQDSSTLQVLMLGYMSPEALEKTLELNKITFWSRTKKRLWTKGESSGNALILESLVLDCDSDTLLATVSPIGPTCHLETTSCFGADIAPGIGFLAKLNNLIIDRYEKKPKDSYTTHLFNKGLDKIAQKVGEEAVETVIASKNKNDEEFIGEVSDLIFHLFVLLKSRDIKLSQILGCLRGRHK